MTDQKEVPTVEEPQGKQHATKTMDEAAQYLARNAGFEPLSAEEERKMIRKMDWILLPMVYLDITDWPGKKRLTVIPAIHDRHPWCSGQSRYQHCSHIWPGNRPASRRAAVFMGWIYLVDWGEFSSQLRCIVLRKQSIVGMWPSTYLVHRLPSAKYLTACSTGWSILALLIPVSRNWGGLMALRFFMGMS